MKLLVVGRLRIIGQNIVYFVRNHARLIGVIIGLIVLVQLLYPRGMTKPITLSSGNYIGLKSVDKTKAYYDSKLAQPINVNIDGQQKTIQAGEVGLSVDQQRIKAKLANYPLWQRVIPASFLLPDFASQDDWRSVDQAKLESASQDLSSAYYQAPVSAGAAKNEQGDYVLSSSKTGRELPKDTIKNAITGLPIEKSNNVDLQVQNVEPVIKDSVVQEIIDKTKIDKLQPITFKVADKSYPISAKVIQSWLTITIDEREKSARLGFDETAINTWLDESIKAVNSGRPTVVTIRDGVELSRVVGVAGQGLDKQKAKDSITQAVLNQQKDITGEIVPLPLAIQTNRTYSASANGLKLLLDEWQKEYPGMQSAVYLRELSGRGLTAERNADSSLFAASMTKLFVAQYIFDTIADLNQIVYDDRTYNTCIDLMIRNSDNTCVEKIGEKHSYNSLARHTLNKGFAQTNLNANTTSARNAGQYIERLNSGSILDPEKTARMLSLMYSQVYRSGIPAGSPGSTVADKPGFDGDSWHDAALVSSPGSTYVLVVMTKGPGSNAVKTLAQRVNQTLNQ